VLTSAQVDLDRSSRGSSSSLLLWPSATSIKPLMRPSIFFVRRERERERERQRQRERELNKVEGMAGNVIFVINAFTDKLGRDTCSHGIHNSFELFVKRDSFIVLENIKFRSFI